MDGPVCALCVALMIINIRTVRRLSGFADNWPHTVVAKGPAKTRQNQSDSDPCRNCRVPVSETPF